MTDGGTNKGLRDRITSGTEDRLGRALGDLLDNPLLNGAIGRASDAREKATQAQELAMGALNLPSAADMERLTRRLRSVSLRLEGIEDGVHRIGRALPGQTLDSRLAAIEDQLGALSRAIGDVRESLAARRRDAAGSTGAAAAGKRPAPKRASGSAPKRASGSASKRSTGSASKGSTGSASKGSTGSASDRASGSASKRSTAKPGEAAKSGPRAKSGQAAKATARRRPAAKG